MRESGLGISRAWIIMLQIFGTIGAVIMLIVFGYYFSQVSESIAPGETYSKVIASMILAILCYLTWKTIYSAVVIIRFISKATDDDISNNRYIISALSLNLGGFVTPFILTHLPNIDGHSSINPRWFLTRIMGVTSFVGGLIALFAFYNSALIGSGALTNQQLFDTTQTAGQISVIFFVSQLALIAFGAISIGMFYFNKNSLEIFEENGTTYSTIMHIVAYIWMAILTIELVLTLVFAIIRLIGSFARLLKAFTEADSGIIAVLYMMLLLFSLFFNIRYTFWVVKMTWEAITGLWYKDGVQYKTYKNLDTRQKEGPQLI